MKKKFKIALIVYGIAVISFITYEGIVYYQDQMDLRNLDSLSSLVESVQSDAKTEETSSVKPTTQTDAIEPTHADVIKTVLPEYSELYKQNPDLAGWLKIPGTKLNYPVMYTPDQGDYYLYKDFSGQNSKHGLPFIDRRSQMDPRSTNILIHGHNMKDGTMFATLTRYQSQSFFENNPYIEFDTIYERGRYEVVSAFMTQIYPDDSSEFMYYQFIEASTESEFNEYVQNSIDLSLYDSGVIPEFGDELLTLSTCSYHVGDGRMVILARKIDEAKQGAID